MEVSMGKFYISEVQTEYQKNPLGLDTTQPHFLWKIAQEEGSYIQGAYRILVGTSRGAHDVWDSGKVESRESAGIRYGGKALAPCTRYYVTITVWDENGESATDDGNWFETGLLNSSIEAWDGAQWIGAPEKYVRSDTIGVFVLKTGIQIAPGSSRAGVVFGANDARLMDARKNQYEIAGENYIRYVLDVSTIPAKLVIYRVGYHPDDRADVPFAETPVVPFSKDGGAGAPVITEENRYDEHQLTIEVIGDCAYTYVDDVLVDAELRESPFGATVEARQLNPLGFNDTTTFPRLCEIGYYVGAGDTVHFSGLSVYNYRTPKARIVALDPDGITLSGENGEKQIVTDPSAHALPMFGSHFTVSGKKVRGARLYITTRGIYDCCINGKAVTDTWLNPGASQYDKHIMYQTYDVTGLLLEGENGIGVTLSSGWWCDAQTFVLRNYNYYGDQESFLAKLEVTYEDGSVTRLVTNTSDWDYYGEGPYLYAGLFQGEHLDGRRLEEYERFSVVDGTAECVTSDKKKPVVITPEPIESYSTMPPGFGRPWPAVDHTDTKIVGGVNSPVREVERVRAKRMTEPRKGLYLYDLGQEMAGVPSIRFHGKAGENVTIRYGEMLYPKLPEYGALAGLILTENYRDAESIDHYILRGDEEGEVFCPRFTFHGFRYIEISGIEQPPHIEEVEGIQLSSIEKITGELTTSNQLLNRFIENVKWSQLCNFISSPTDCPQRNERMGWAGDTHVFCRTATYQSDTRLFYYRYLQALRDLQEADGQLPNIAPVGGGFGGITYECAMIFMVWELYQQYADKDVIEEYYESMSRWLTYMHEKGMPGKVFVGPLGDWLAPDETDDYLMWNAFYYRCAYLLARMAQIIGKNADAATFGAYAADTKKYWNETFVDTATGKTKGIDGNSNDTQCAYALPLAYDVFEEKYKSQAFAHLARKTKEADCTVHTGFFGTGVLNPMLSAGGYHDLAYELIQQTNYPSWLYPVTQGATTIWERWNSYTKEAGFGGNNSMNSFNHYSLGSVLSWMYETVLGIRRDETHPGYEHFYLEPQIQSLDFAKGGFETVYGRIESSWESTKTGYVYRCQIPCNTTATLHLECDGRIIERELASGTYEFRI